MSDQAVLVISAVSIGIVVGLLVVALLSWIKHTCQHKKQPSSSEARSINKSNFTLHPSHPMDQEQTQVKTYHGGDPFTADLDQTRVKTFAGGRPFIFSCDQNRTNIQSAIAERLAMSAESLASFPQDTATMVHGAGGHTDEIPMSAIATAKDYTFQSRDDSEDSMTSVFNWSLPNILTSSVNVSSNANTSEKRFNPERGTIDITVYDGHTNL